MDVAISLWKEYSGQGLILTLFLIALFYLWFQEKDNQKRKVLVWFPITILFVFFCPVVVLLMKKLAEEDIYWRLLWSIPMLTVIAYSCVRLLKKAEGIKRYLAMAGCVLAIAVSGSYLYDNEGFVQAENPEHIPQTVIDICDSIIVEGREVRALFPQEFLVYVPQYTPLVHMPYGREVFLLSDGAKFYDTLYMQAECLIEDTIQTKEFAQELRERECHYAVLREDAPLTDKMENEDFIEYERVDGYVIYLDKNNDPHF